ncbi:MAG: tRNA lysidine(34) synthetase TilS [Cardiobacteriaceae bacterium]|nr:tRNA lysidine(34) synthetase TilS [Cardiobacteriaceae bacterium]
MLNAQAPFWHWQKEKQATAYLLALSGGRDSMALLHALVAQREQLCAPLMACYVDHGWSSASEEWGNFCQQVAAAYAVPCEIVRLDWPTAYRDSPEALARTLRYQALAQHLPVGGVLLTAHHHDDQAETLLLQLLRGSGLDGLAAMPARRHFAQGEHWRPLLYTSRAAINAYVAAQGIAYLDDPSNLDNRYLRNKLRHSVLPVLTDTFPQAITAIARSADWLAEALTLQQALLDGLLGSPLPVLPWQQLQMTHGITTAKALLRRWLQRAGQLPPPAARLQAFVIALMRPHNHAELCYANTVVVRHKDMLHLYQASIPDSAPSFSENTEWAGIGSLTLRAGHDLLAGKTCRWALYPCAAHWHASGQRYPTSLKNFLQNHDVPPYLRRRLPLLMVDDVCVWLGGFGAAAGWEALVLDWQKQAHSVSIPHHFL